MQIKAEIGGGPEQHARMRLAERAVPPVAADTVFRMVWAEIDGRQGRAPAEELPFHPAHEPPELSFVVVAAPYARLIGDDNGQKAACHRRRGQREDAFDEMDVLFPVDLAVVQVDDAVAVKKERSVGCHGPACACFRRGTGRARAPAAAAVGKGEGGNGQGVRRAASSFSSRTQAGPLASRWLAT